MLSISPDVPKCSWVTLVGFLFEGIKGFNPLQLLF